jgi:fumarate hydratase class II
MSVQDPTEQLWGGETTKAVANFPVSGERVPVTVVRQLGRIKGAAARVNADLGLLDAELAQRITAAADEIASSSSSNRNRSRRVGRLIIGDPFAPAESRWRIRSWTVTT